jgi:hypothetical protein
MFVPFDLCFLLYHVCVHDVHIVVRALHAQKSLPRGVSLPEFLELDRSYQFNWLWLQVYPKRWTQTRLSFPPLIFVNSDASGDFLKAAGAFECFLEHSRHRRRLTEWQTLLSEELDVSCGRCADFLRANPKLATSRKLSQRVTLALIDDGFLAPHFRELAEYAERWDIVVNRWSGLDLRSFVAEHGCAVSRLHECERTLHSLEVVPIWQRFHLLLAALVQITVILDQMRASREAFGTVLKAVPGKVVLVSFIVLNGTVARVRDFFTEDQRIVWCRFEAMIYSMLTQDTVLTLQIASKIDDIAFDFKKKCVRFMVACDQPNQSQCRVNHLIG